MNALLLISSIVLWLAVLLLGFLLLGALRAVDLARSTYSRFSRENVVMRQCTSFLAIVTTMVLFCADANACFFRGRRHRCQTSYYTPACYDPGQAQQTTNQPTQTNSPNKEIDELGLPALKELPKLPEAYFPSQQP